MAKFLKIIPYPNFTNPDEPLEGASPFSFIWKMIRRGNFLSYLKTLRKGIGKKISPRVKFIFPAEDWSMAKTNFIMHPLKMQLRRISWRLYKAKMNDLHSLSPVFEQSSQFLQGRLRWRLSEPRDKPRQKLQSSKG